MDNEKISTADVKRYFLLANAGKSLFKPKAIKSKLDDNYKRILDKIFELEENELDERITDKVRLERYNCFNWSFGQKELNKIGPWPKMGSLDIRLTTGNIIETAQSIKDILKSNGTLGYENIAKETKEKEAFDKFVRRSESIKDNLNFVYERFPIILFLGGEIREKDYNNWARENNEPLCNIFDYDLDDGNNRAVAYAIVNIKTAPCLYGSEK